MTGKRIPKQDEVWTWYGFPRTVLAVDGDRVAIECEDGHRFITTVDHFTDTYTPPEPTVKDVAKLHVGSSGRIDFLARPVTHRLEVLTDGTVRVVEVDG
jgi:hypothetical protein